MAKIIDIKSRRPYTPPPADARPLPDNLSELLDLNARMRGILSSILTDLRLQREHGIQFRGPGLSPVTLKKLAALSQSTPNPVAAAPKVRNRKVTNEIELVEDPTPMERLIADLERLAKAQKPDSPRS